MEDAGFYASEEALLREIEVRGPDRHSSPAPHGERAPSTAASSEDGDRPAQPAAAQRPLQRKGGVARRGGAVGKGSGAAEAPSAIRLADPVRCRRNVPSACPECDVPVTASRKDMRLELALAGLTNGTSITRAWTRARRTRAATTRTP